MNWRMAFIATVALAVTVISFLAYSVMDQAVTISYMSDGYGSTQKDLEALAAAFPRDRYSKKDILVVLRRNEPKSFIVETPCTIQQGGLRFEFDAKGALVNINTRAEYSPEMKCGI